MRQKLFAVLLTLPLLLAACGGGDEHRAEAIRAKLEQSTVACEAEVTAVYETETETFTLSCAETADGADLRVPEPEMLSGVTAHVTGEDCTLAFDTLVLPAPLEPDGISPLTALPMLLHTLREGHLDLVWREGDALAAQYLLEDDLAVRVFFTADDAPAYAEIIQAGETAVRCTITQWNPTEKEDAYESDDSNVGGDQSQHPGT